MCTMVVYYLDPNYTEEFLNKINYGLVCEKIIEESDRGDVRPSLLLHVCCAPCSSYVIEYLERHFDLTLYFYNPNITDTAEFAYRLDELYSFIDKREGKNYRIIVPEYRPEEFFEAVKGYEDIPEGGMRCYICYELRLRKTALAAKALGFDYFTTTLSVSPYKNAAVLCETGDKLATELGIKYLPSDFKKKGGYLRSIELSSIYELYRQDYCGCCFSQSEAKARKLLNSRENNYR